MPNATVAAIVLCSEAETYVRRTALAALASLCRPVVVAARHESTSKELAGLPVDFVAGSVRSGLQTALHSTPHLDAVVLLRCDQPLVTAGSIRRLLVAFQRARIPIAAAASSRSTGLPAIFGRAALPKLLALEPAEDPVRVIRENPDQVIGVQMPEAAESEFSTECAHLHSSQ
jgi:molybdenum cofactor cytidylyltransferase